MATVTVTELIAEARQKADMVNTRFVTDAFVLSALNNRNNQLNALLITNQLMVDELEQVITADGSAYYAFPTRYFSTLDVYYDPGGSQDMVRLHRTSNRSRPRTTNIEHAESYGTTSSGLVLKPAPTTGTYRHFYIPSPLKLVETVSDANTEVATVNYPMGWEEFLSVGAAIDCLSKEETVNPELNKKIAQIERRIEHEASLREYSENPGVQRVEESPWPFRRRRRR